VALLTMVILVGLGEKMAERFLPIYLMVLGGGALTIGLLGGMTNLLSALYSFPGGYLSDRLGYKKALLVFNLIALFGYAIVIIFPYWQAVIIGAIFFLSWSAISLPATMSLVSRVLPQDKRTMGVTMHSLVRRLPMALGPIIGGVLIGIYGDKTGVRLAFVGAFFLGLLSLVLQQVMIEADSAQGKAEKRPSRLWRYMSPALKNLLVSDILIRFAEQIPYAFVVVWCIKNQGITATQFGLLTAIEMITAVLVYLPVAYLAEAFRRDYLFQLHHFSSGNSLFSFLCDDGDCICYQGVKGIWRADAQGSDYGSGAGGQKSGNVRTILFD
jgi:MFS family permease